MTRPLVLTVACAPMFAALWLPAPARAQRERRFRPPETTVPADQPKPATAAGKLDSKSDKKDEKKGSEPSTTHHEVTINGKLIRYTARAGFLEMPDYEGKPKANVFYIAYVKDADGTGAEQRDAAGKKNDGDSGEDQKASDEKESDADSLKGPLGDPSRPITFAFNGGPGSSSVWLHLGAIGPRRVDFADPNEKPGDPAAPLPPYKVVDNDFSWLDLTDVVFIDPVSTGYSRPVEGQDANQFHGLQEDIQWVGDFIRLWTTRNRRWESPKFLAGESYGTTRAAGLSGYLQDSLGMYLNGIVLVSPVLDFQTISFDQGNDSPYWLYLPTYTASAWYHHKLPPELERDLPRTLQEVSQWASTEYLVALGRGDGLSPQEADGIATKLARYTGLSKEYVLQSKLRIEISHFDKELLRAEGRTVGRYDSRYVGIDRSGVNSTPEYDPSYSVAQGAFTAAFNSYIRSELKFENDNPYEILTGRVHPWNFSSATNRYADVADTLRGAMTRNPALHVLVVSGFYDLATPFFAATYTIDHLGLSPAIRGHIGQTFYQAGHMVYLHHQDLEKLKADVAAFYAKSLADAGAGGGAAGGAGGASGSKGPNGTK